jgi:anti-sigma factor RsiW
MDVSNSDSMGKTNCADFRAFIDPYVDGEFDERERAMFDAHVASCKDCRDHFEQRTWLITAVKPTLKSSCQLSGHARARLQKKLRTARRPGNFQRTAKRFAQPLPAVMVVGVALLFFMPLTGFKTNVVENVVDQHCQKRPVEVPSPETREVDDWFADKLPFTVATPQFRDRRVMLMGGRLSQFRTKGQERTSPAAHILYRVGAHKMSVLVFQSKDLAKTQVKAMAKGQKNLSIHHDARGYRVALVRRGNLTYAVTSTLPENEMVTLLGTSL